MRTREPDGSADHNARQGRLARNASVKVPARYVARWDGGEMVLRWLAVAVIEASKTFRKLRVHKGMPKLVAALRAQDAKLSANTVVVDVKGKAA